MEKYSLRQAENESADMQEKIQKGEVDNYSEAEQQIENEKNKWGKSEYFQKMHEKIRLSEYEHNNLTNPEILEKKFKQKDYDGVAKSLLDYLDKEALQTKVKQSLGKDAPNPTWDKISMDIIAKDPQFFEKHKIQLNIEETELVNLFIKVNAFQLSKPEPHGGPTEKMESLLPKEMQSDKSSRRFQGITNIISATVDSRPDLQPCGAKIIEISSGKNIPSVVVSGSNHGKGSQAACAVNEYLNNSKILSGVLLNDGDMYDINLGEKIRPVDINVFHIVKTPKFNNDKEIDKAKTRWQFVFNEIQRKISENNFNGNKGKILIVEDNPKVIEIIKQAVPKEMELEFATDYISAEEKFKINDYKAVISDLFMPYDTNSQNKSFGEKVCLDVVSSVIGKDKAEKLMSEAKDLQSKYEKAVSDSYHKISTTIK